MDRAAGAVPLEARQPEALGHDPLAGEGGVAVDAGAACTEVRCSGGSPS